MRNTQVEKLLSSLNEERWVITFKRISWDASSASGNVPSIRSDRLNTMSWMLPISASRDSLSPLAAMSINSDTFRFLFIFLYLL